MPSRSSSSALRIASLQPSISLTLQQLGALNLLVACTKYCVAALPQLRQTSIAIIADSWSSTAQEILATRPNLVLASVPYRMESLAEILKAGCPVLTLAPHTLADIFHDIRLIAAVVEKSDQAEICIADMQRVIADTRAIASNQQHRPTVYCEEWGKPLIHSQPWVQQLVEAAGGIFIGAAGKTTTAEAVAAANPDVMLFAWCGAGDRVPLEKTIEKRGWQHLNAVQQRRIFCVPDEYFNTPAHTLLDGLACAAFAIHPERFPAPLRLRQILASK